MENLLYIIWSDKSLTGIAIIDEQHRGIVSAINSLHYFIKAGQGGEALSPTLKLLEYYIDVHFKTEERLMSAADYPALKEHLRQHIDLSGKTKEFAGHLTGDQEAEAVLSFLREWWMNHINREDKKYVPYVMELIKN